VASLLAQGRVTKPPVEVDELARLCGVHVLPAQLRDDISGILLDLESGPVIGYNAGHPPVRQRFSIAHELAHFVLAHHDHFHIDLSDAGSHGDPPGYDWRDERDANETAAQLLMPASPVIQAYDEESHLGRLASKFKVSREAMGWRLVNLELLK
jgi:Zn-dependent peptidase ImmA (M78 family)